MNDETRLQRLARLGGDFGRRFQSAYPLQAQATVLAEALSTALPLKAVALVLLNEDGVVEQTAVWPQTEGAAMGRLWEAGPGGLARMAGQACDKVRVEPLEGRGGRLGYVAAQSAAPWQVEEQQFLAVLAAWVALALEDGKRLMEAEGCCHTLATAMDHMGALIYVTDVASDRILYMNQAMKQAFGLEHPEGQVCWQVLQKGMSGRCAFCPVERLQRSQEPLPAWTWEETNTANGRVYENYDTILPWLNGRPAHLQHSVDVTQAWQQFHAANRDELTEFYTRRKGKDELAAACGRAARRNDPMTVGLFDLNGLKEINDAFGHSEGDRIIRLVAEAVRQQLREEDFAFRLSGDEFVAVFCGLGRDEARQRLQAALDALQRRKEERDLPYDVSFCYGLVEWDGRITPAECLAQADEQMYEQKRRFHIARREAERLSAAEHRQEALVDFSCDERYLYDALVQSTDDYLFVCDMKTDTFRYPKAMVEEFGLPGQVVRNAAAVWGARVHEHDKQAFLEANQDITDGRAEAHSVEYRALNRRGEWVWVRCRGRLERDEAGEPVLFAGFIANLGKKNRMDHVSGLFNKFEFESEAKRLLENPSIQSLGMMILDLDDFKHINDLYDRTFGDEVLRITAQKIQGILPPHAAVFRLDGDEFGILVTNTQATELQRIYTALSKAFRRQQEYDGKKFFCTLSAGCALYPKDGAAYLDLLKYAHYSLEYAKVGGKNRMHFFAQDILSRKERSLALTECLRDSVEHNFEGFSLVYQPQIDAVTGRVVGAEALARWYCEAYGEVPPVEFIPLLEESGLIQQAGRWIFTQAAAMCKAWVERQPGFVMSVNLSYLQMREPDLTDFMQHTLDALGLDANNLVVELTESQMVRNMTSIRHIFEDIRQLGVRIAMDDFGTGYSSLGVLKNAPADIVKIDRAFIKDIRTSHFDATFIRFIVALCHDVGIHVCLEGVETQEEYEIVQAMELDSMQGYLFGHPVPANAFEKQYLDA